MSIWTNDGTGAFAHHGAFLTGDTGPAGVTAADFNHDGWIDLAIAHDANIECNNTVSVLRNVNGGDFASPVVYDVGNCPQVIHAADIDGDGSSDLVIGHGRANRWSLLMNDSKGDFAFAGATTGIPSGPLAENAALCVDDVDLDGDDDVLFAQQDTGAVGAGAAGLWRNDGKGGFGAPEVLSFAFWSRGAVDIASGDVTGDGWPDIAAVTGVEGNWFLFEGDGTGGFLTPRHLRAGHRPNAVRLVDLEGDGDLDVTVLAAWSLEACVYVNGGTGDFVQPAALDFADPAIAPAFVSNVESGDVDGDGDADLVAAFRSDFSASHGITVRLNEGDGSFGARLTLVEPT